MSKEDNIVLIYIQSYWSNFPVSANVLENPNEEFAKNFYQAFIEDYVSMLSMMGNCNTQKILSVNEIYLCAQINEILSEVGVDFFSLNDIYSPRIRFKLMSKICINLLLYMRNVTELNSTLLQEILEKSELNDQLINENKEQTEQLSEIVKTKAFDEDKISSLEKECDVLEEKLKEAKGSEEKQTELENKKQEFNTLKWEYESNKNTSEKLTKEIELLQNQITSPDEFKQLQSLCEQLKCERKDLDMYHEEYRSTLEKKQNIFEFLTLQEQKCLKTDYKPLNMINVKKAKDKEVSTKEEVIANINEQDQNCALEMLKLNDELCKDEEQFCQVQMQLMNLKKSVDNELVRLKGMLNNIVEEYKNTKNSLNSAQKCIKELKLSSLQIENETIKFNKEVENEHKLMKEAENLLVAIFCEKLKQRF